MEFLPHLQGFPQMVGLGEGEGQSINGRGNKQDERKYIFSMMENTESMSQGDNSAGQWFVLGDLVLMSFFK